MSRNNDSCSQWVARENYDSIIGEVVLKQGLWGVHLEKRRDAGSLLELEQTLRGTWNIMGQEADDSWIPYMSGKIK